MQDGRILTADTIKKKVKEATKGRWVGGNRAKYAGYGDRRYYLPTNVEAATFLSNQAYPGFQDDAFDCEDFAFVCKGYVSNFQQQQGNVPDHAAICIGIAWGRFAWINEGNQDHACNWIMDNLGTLSWYEPQTNLFHPSSSATAKKLRLMLL